MKKEIFDIFKHFVIGWVIGLIASGLMLWSYNVGKKHCSTVETITDTITVTDTITNLKYDTTYFNHYDTIPYEVVVNDTLKDTLYIPIALNTYKWDTSIVDSNYETNLKLTATGYDVTLDTVVLNTNIHYNQPIKIKEKWYNNIVPAIGIGYGTAGWGAFVGIGYKLL